MALLLAACALLDFATVARFMAYLSGIESDKGGVRVYHFHGERSVKAFPYVPRTFRSGIPSGPAEQHQHEMPASGFGGSSSGSFGRFRPVDAARMGRMIRSTASSSFFTIDRLMIRGSRSATGAMEWFERSRCRARLDLL